MSEALFDDLYRDVLLEHYRSPRHRGRLAAATHHADGMNPVCGDEVAVDLAMDGDVVTDVAFEGQGCSISQASASMMAERIHERTRAEVALVKDAFEAMLVAGAPAASVLGDLEAFEGVARFPIRVKCALLPWKVLEQGLASPVSQGGHHD
jgi:nitrogen fixation NifU-like protein